MGSSQTPLLRESSGNRRHDAEGATDVMIDLDTQRFPADIANLLLLRGADLPSLQWQLRPNQSAKEMLDKLPDDADLFRRKSLPDEGMCAGVRALLYLWNGWPTECRMFAQAAPEPERLYLDSIMERHAGHPHESKAILQQLEDHPIHPRLMSYTLEVIGLGSDPALNRLKQMLELGETWEPFSFIDLFEQVRAGKVCNSTEQIVHGIQCREFELLFVHCYEAGTGEQIPEAPAAEAPERRKPKPATKARSPRPRPPEKPKEPAKGAAKDSPVGARTGLLPQKGPRVGTRCPKCTHMVILPVSRRGTKERCPKCQTAFLIPGKPPAKPVATSTPPAE